MALIGFVINPTAGMGGRVGLKGTDDVAERARALGARPSAERKATATLTALATLLGKSGATVRWLTAGGHMGADCLAAAGFDDVEVVHSPRDPTSAADTKAVTRIFLDREVALIVFCGGDGTARDIAAVARQRVPILGVPAGVKMYSGVFATSPARAAEIIERFVNGDMATGTGDILDLDEEEYRHGRWEVRLCDVARVPVSPAYVQSAKSVIRGLTEAETKAQIAETLAEDAAQSADTLYVLGPGSTLAAVGERLGIAKTLLGIDAVKNGRQVGRDLNEEALLQLLGNSPVARLIVSPIGAQGFVLGRGNLPLSPRVVRKIGIANVVVVATPEKLAQTPTLRFDTGDDSLDAALCKSGYVAVVTGYRQRRLVPATL